MKLRTFAASHLLIAILTVFWFAGCKQDEIRWYRVPREVKKGLQYDVPPTWAKLINTSDLIKAKYLIKGKEKEKAYFNISAFVDQGGLLLNVNRWRKQVKLQEIGKTELAKNVTKIKIAGKAAHLVDIQGPEEAGNERILVAILPYENKSWYFRLSGPKGLLDREKDRFDALLKTITFGDDEEK